MKIDDLIKDLNYAKKQSGNLNIYVEVNADENCPTCGQSETHIYDGFPDHTVIMNIDSIPTFAIVAERDALRQK